MTALLWILAVLLGLLLLMLAVCLLLLCVRTGIEAVGVNGEVSVEIRYGPARIPVWPPPKREEAPPQTAAAPAKRKKGGKNPNTGILFSVRNWISGSWPD